MKRVQQRRRGRRQGKRRGGSGLAAQDARVTEVIIGVPFTVSQATSGNGLLTNYESPLSLSSASSVILDPYNIGGRLSTVAELYGQYAVLDGQIEYRPHVSSSGVYGATGTVTTTPNYASRQFALGLSSDPAFTGSNFIGVLQQGGRDCNITRPARIPIPRACCNRWLFTTTTTASPTAIDYRMSAFGVLCGRWFDNSATTSNTYGTLVLRMRVAFRGPTQVSAQIGFSSTDATRDNDDEKRHVVGSRIGPFKLNR